MTGTPVKGDRILGDFFPVVGYAFIAIYHLLYTMFGRRTNVRAEDLGGGRRPVKRSHHRVRDSGKESGRRERGEHRKCHVEPEEESMDADEPVLEWAAQVPESAEPADLPWRSDPILEGWVKRNLSGSCGRRHSEGALVVVGPRLGGKRTWAKKFGPHVELVSLYSSAAVDAGEDGYVVCQHMGREFPYAKQLLGCQPVVAMAGEDGRVRQRQWGRPCIWICDEWDDPRRWSPEMAGFVKQTCTVFDMKEHGWRKMYVDDTGSEAQAKPEVEDDVLPMRGPEGGKDKKDRKDVVERREKGGRERKDGEEKMGNKVSVNVSDALDLFC